jgi:hypothetical protein
MRRCAPFLLLFVAARTHDNSLFNELRATGTTIGHERVRLPDPWMTDGLTPSQQAAVLRDLPRRQVPTEELTRPSVVAPFVLNIRDLSDRGPANTGRAIDLAFVAYGDLDRLAASDFLEQLLNTGRKDAHIHTLSAADVLHRHLTVAANEGLAHVRLSLMDRVELTGTNRTTWSRSAVSVVVAGRLDPRFTRDSAYPNQWRSLSRDESGKVQPAGPGHPYEAAAYYVKITRLHEPAGALFVEWHLVFAEPQEWFDGANLLRSKLPMVLQTKVRGFRRDLLRDR